MIDEGLIDEVKALLDSDKLDSKTNSMKSVGYKQICEYLETKCSLVEAKDNAKTSTRRLAKRQLTWLRSESSDIEFDIYNDNIIDKAKLALDSFINDKQS
jgi:tRNA dimethylallyltransferase